ncbi:NHLP leader peptide family RiPP precursor [uncultured Tenacibaculum sp.]|uniref:NHLP leader peptide family RiPP precursor n=1 Tax=uncultured Tenacibaculum sp. TaxID=174713 RepID=UPI002632212C|nr:NHLP leader peptide family RiPP precursor [uncultured Tenacibaculum sp.]
MILTREQKEETQELLNKLVVKSWEDNTFKSQLISNPKETIEEFAQTKFDEKVNLVVEDQTDSSKIYINIPRNINNEDMELSDEQLETVSGGDVGTVLAVIAVASLIYSGGKAIYDGISDGIELANQE